MTPEIALDRIEQTSKIVSAYVSHNPIAATSLPEFITRVHRAVAGLQQAVVAPQEAVSNEPAVSIKKSVSPNALTCLECGLKFKSLKRHLKTSHKMTPDQYRLKWSLPASYPMVSPNYSVARSGLAKSFGLGRKRA